MKKFAALFIAFLILFSVSACSTPGTESSDSSLMTTPYKGFLLNPGTVCTVTGPQSFKYEVIPNYTGDKLAVVSEAEALICKWWNDDSTFTKPEIVWVTIYSGDIRGFQDTGYLFLDPNTSYEDLLATAVHEWLHDLVDPATLIELDTGWGRPIMEYTVEGITIDILKGIVDVFPAGIYTDLSNTEIANYRYQLQRAFRAQKSLEAYEELFGQNYKEVINQMIFGDLPF